MKKSKRLDHGYLGKYAKVEATDTCRECGGKLNGPVPHHCDFHQTCEPCWTTIELREAYRPRTQPEAEAALRWSRWLVAKFPPDGQMVRRRDAYLP